MTKIKYKPKVDCCSHYTTDTFTIAYQANPVTEKVSNFKVYICDNCGEVHDPYGGIKGFLSELYFRFISKGFIFIPMNEQKNGDE